MRKFLVVIASIFFYAQTVKADVDCSGKVQHLSLALTTTGVVTVALEGGPTMVYLCAIDGPVYNGVSSEVCKAMYSTLMAAKLSGKKVLIRFYGQNSCALPGWTNYPVGWTQVLAD